MSNYKIAIVSDTHGLLRPEVLKEIKGCNIIIHAGDVGNCDIVEALKKEAKLIIVRGNCDNGNWAEVFPKSEFIELQGFFIYILHNIYELDVDLEAMGVNVVIYGHSHKPESFYKNNILYINPGSAGPRRFKLPITVAELNIENGLLKNEIIDLTISQ